MYVMKNKYLPVTMNTPVIKTGKVKLGRSSHCKCNYDHGTKFILHVLIAE